ncbi:MAG: hypothetical protein EHM64_16075 [Ignavibacteriae bacterium]|nr:MAG: hypothetical protein EHM64_16075 [Ignavibacteriota bacterium]
MKRIIFLSILLFSGCSDLGTDASNGLAQLSIQDSIREAVFRYQFQHNASGQQQTAKIYFLSVMILNDSTGYWIHGNPSLDILSHFNNNVPPVKSFSDCTLSVNGVFDNKTGENGLLFQVGALRWITEEQVEVDGGYFEGGLSASGNTYYLERKNAQWIVTRDVMHWIS